MQDGQERVVAYFSQTLKRLEKNYCVTRKELLAVVKAIEHFNYYLYGTKFRVRTDHSALQWLMNFREPQGQVARWLEKLQIYDYVVEHRSGSSHKNADALSRRPCLEENCKQCSRYEERFQLKTVGRVTKPCKDQVETGDQQTEKTEMSFIDNLEWEKQQVEDSNLKAIVQAMKSSERRPEWTEISPQGEKTKTLWAQWDSLRNYEYR